MKLKFSLKLSLLVLLAATFCFPATYSSAATLSSVVDATENAKVLAGIQYIAGQHAKRCGDFNTDPETTSANSVETDNIIQLLSNPARVSKQEACEDQKRVIATSVMATVFVHGGTKKLNRNHLDESHHLYRHFRALELIEDLSVVLNENLKDHDRLTVLDDRFLSSNWAAYRDLETYSQITKELFALWFNEALKEHHDGFLRLVVISEFKKQELIAEKGGQDVIAEQVRQDKIKAAAEEEKRQKLIELAELAEEEKRQNEAHEQEDARIAKEEQATAEKKMVDQVAEKLRQDKEEEALDALRGATGSSADETGGNDHFATPKKKLNFNPEIQTPSKRLKAAAERTAPYENEHTLNASIGGMNFEFRYFKVSDDLNDTNYLGLGMTRSDFEARISSAEKEGFIDIYQEMIASEDAGAVGDLEVTTKGDSVTEAQIMEAFANYYLGSGQLVLASKLLAETPICIWKEKNGACILESVYSNGEILSEISSVQENIKKMKASLVHLYHTEDDYYDSLQLIIEKKKENAALSSNSAVVRTSYFSNPTVQLRLAGGVGVTTLFALMLAKLNPEMSKNIFGGVFNFGFKFVPGIFRGFFKR